MHVFITGPNYADKTDIVNRVVQASGVEPAGFVTRKGQVAEDKSFTLFMLPACERERNVNETTKKVRLGHGDGKRIDEFDLSGFNNYGVSLLRDAHDAPLILMDQLGFLENEAKEFQEQVLATLSGDAPVLGVMQSCQTSFLDMLRKRSDITLIEVRKDGQEQAFTEALGRVQRILH